MNEKKKKKLLKDKDSINCVVEGTKERKWIQWNFGRHY
jgi:hypothetical protein